MGNVETPQEFSLDIGLDERTLFCQFLVIVLLFRGQAVLPLWLRFNLSLGIVGFLFRRPFENRRRRKFRSQTSDNMQRWKSRGGKSQDGEVKK